MGGTGGAGVWIAAVGDDGLELLELLDDGRDGYRLNLMLDCFLTDRPRSGASGMLPAWAPPTMLTVSVSGRVSSCRGPGRW